MKNQNTSNQPFWRDPQNTVFCYMAAVVVTCLLAWGLMSWSMKSSKDNQRQVDEMMERTDPYKR